MSLKNNYSVKAIFIYPIKSLGGVSLNSAMAMTEGFEYDRRWMLVDEEGQFLSQRNNSNMALFKTDFENGNLQVTYKEDKISFSMNDVLESEEQVQVWSSKLKAQEVNKEVSQWFSEHLSMKSKLVKMTNVSKRPKVLTKAPFKTHLSLADGYPYLILGDASMDHLNAQLQIPIDANRFRANIYVSTDKAHEEDGWSNIKAGEAQLKGIKPCARCSVITINQETAEQGKEPLKTLAKYRQKANKILFGANAICTKEGIISVGDQLHF